MIGPILRKDWKLLWPMVALVTAIQVGFEWVSYFGDRPGAAVLIRPLILAWYAGIAAVSAAVVLQDPLPGADQDWLIRPVRRSDMILAKLAFLGLSVSVPMGALNFAHAMALGFPFRLSLEVVLYKEAYLFVCFVVPMVALAAVARNMTEFIVTGALLVVVYTLSLSLSAFFFGAEWCPTCDTGLSWLQHVMQHAGILVGAGIILGLQYHRRRTELARAVAVVGVVALVFVQLPWDAAFTLQRWVARSAGVAAPLTFEFGGLARGGGTTGVGSPGKAPGPRQAAALLLQGHVDQAVESLHRAAAAAAPVTVDLPVRISGIPSDQLLLVDRLGVSLYANEGRLLYRRENSGLPPHTFVPGPLGDPADSSGFIHQSIEIPSTVYRSSAADATRLRLDYSLTLVQTRAVYRMAALGGVLRASTVGRCSSRYDDDAVSVHCQTLGRTPFCYSAALYTPDGRHNPEVLKCAPAYQPFLPTPMNVHGFMGVDMPVRDRYGLAHYAVGDADLSQAYVILKIYGALDHFVRTLIVSPFRLDDHAGLGQRDSPHAVAYTARRG